MRLAESLLGPLEVALQPLDLTNCIQPVRHDRSDLELFKLLGGPPEFLLRLLPASLERCDLRAVDPAHAREPPDRLGFAPPVGQLDPFRCSLVIGQVAACPDHPACRDARGEWRQLAIHGRDRRLLQQPDSLIDGSGRDSEHRLGGERKGVKVLVAGALADRDGLAGEFERARNVARRLCEVGPHECQVAVGIGLGSAAEKTFSAAGPGRGDRKLPPEHECGSDLEGDVRGTDHIARALVSRERALGNRYADVGVAGEECRDRKRLKICSIECHYAVGLRELIKRIAPCVPCERLAAGAQGLRYVAFGGMG